MTVTELGGSERVLRGVPALVPRWEVGGDADRHTWALRRLLGMREIGVLTILALIGYIASAYWVRYGLHFWINDALNRTDDALYTTVGRDPHLGAIGFYWPPLPQLLQLPLMPFFRPFGAEIMVGPVSTAITMAATIPVLGRLGRRLGLRRWVTFLICLTFAVNPDIIYTASNGMAESCFILSGCVALLGFLTYIQTQSTRDMLVLSLGLSMAIMTRLEGPVLVVALAVVATIQVRALRSSAWRLTTVLLPPLGFFGFWMLVQWVLLGDPLFFLHQNGGPGPKAGTAVWLPSSADEPSASFPWAFGWVLVLGPVLYLLVASVVLRIRPRRLRGSLGILAALGSILAIQIYTVGFGTGFGDPRYFVMCIPFVTVGAMWLAADGAGVLAGAWNLALGATLLVSGGTASYALTSGRITHVEEECSYFQYGVAQVLPPSAVPNTAGTPA